VFVQENIVGENYFLNQSAKEAYRSYILAYNSHAMKDIFNVHDLDMKVQLLLRFFEGSVFAAFALPLSSP
jgi:hypothetical protein